MTASNGMKAIIVTICILCASAFFSSAGLSLLLAAIGGMFVSLGLWIEKEAEEEGKGNTYRTSQMMPGTSNAKGRPVGGF